MKRNALSLFAYVVLAGLIGFAVTCGRDDQASAPSQSEADGAGGAADGVEVPEAMPTAAGQDQGGIPFGDIPAIGPSIVKTAQVSVVVRAGSFTDAFDRAAIVASSHGGFVASSSTSGTESQSGRLVLRVPALTFDQALADVRELGEVERQSISGQDVSAQFVDLEARQRTWEAQESVLLRLMEQATTVDGTLRVQRELQDVQLRLEQILGQLRLLRDRTDLGTITVSLREAGALPIEARGAVDNPSLGEAWDRAVAGFLGVMFSVVVGLGYLIPLSLMALGGLLVYRRARPRRGAVTGPGLRFP